MDKFKTFNKGVKAINAIFEINEEAYLCPLCLRFFNQEAISKKVLTAEHVPQDSIGGNEVLLTCEKCNSESGYKFEADLKERERLKTFIKAVSGKKGFEGKLKIELTMGGKKVNTHTQIKKDKILFKIPKKYNHPDNLDHIFKHLDTVYENQSWSNEKFNISPDISYSKRKVELSYLKTAYLASFALLGYRYILNKEFDVIRQQLLNPSKEIFQPYIFTLPKEIKRERKIISVEKPIKSIAVQIDENIVFLPPVENPIGSLSKIKDYLSKSNEKDQFSGEEFPWPHSLQLVLDFMAKN
ncbi:hypothetical protein [Fodinibius sp.]|uniref:hypothetical protein n=1 Tax=Fodinibius sp. TaxID=1872440 RepID=UPI0035614749